MALSPRDWTEINPNHYSGIYKDSESWAIWCSACYATKKEAIEVWNGFCQEE